jgi:hypothetical protein
VIWRVDERKVLDYLPSGTSVPGAAKNRFFRSIGFAPMAWPVFRDALADHPDAAVLVSVDGSSRYGEKRIYECHPRSPNGANPCVRTV